VTRLMAGIKKFVFECRFVLLSLAASLALHAVLATGVSGKNRNKPPRREELVIELIGIVSNRQLEQKQRGDTSPSSTQKAVAPPPHKAAKKAAKKVMTPTRKASSRMKAMAQPEKTRPEPEQQSEQPAVSTAPPASGKTMPLGAESQQIQQVLKPRESQASLIRKYLARLKRDIQSHLDYPEEARDTTGNVGAPTIRFTITESGDILPGSLSINKSSGSAQLDQQALRAARSSTPLAKPPRQMTVTIKVAFTRDG
jgi:periplasmic protein TonB